MRNSLCFLFLILSIATNAQNPFGSSNANDQSYKPTAKEKKLSTIKRDNIKYYRPQDFVLFAGVTNKAELPYAYVGMKDIELKPSEGEITRDVNEVDFFKWKICNSTSNEVTLFVYKRKKKINTIIYQISHKHRIQAEFGIGGGATVPLYFWQCGYCDSAKLFANDKGQVINLSDYKVNGFTFLSINKTDKDTIFIKNEGGRISPKIIGIMKGLIDNNKEHSFYFFDFIATNPCSDELLKIEYPLIYTSGH